LDTPLLFAMVAIIIATVIIITVIFLRKALRQAREIGLSESVIKKTVRVSGIFSIVPSIPIAIGLAAMGLAREAADRVVFMEARQVVDAGTPQKLFNQAKNPRIQAFLSKIL